MQHSFKSFSGESATYRRDWLKKSAVIGSVVLSGQLLLVEPTPATTPVTRRIPISVSTYSY